MQNPTERRKKEKRKKEKKENKKNKKKKLRMIVALFNKLAPVRDIRLQVFVRLRSTPNRAHCSVHDVATVCGGCWMDDSSHRQSDGSQESQNDQNASRADLSSLDGSNTKVGYSEHSSL